jgi:pimeloyl-ACP methyl ester carboxylesterase
VCQLAIRLSLKRYALTTLASSIPYRTALFAPGSKIPDDYFEVSDRSVEFGRAFSAALKATPVGDWWAGGSCPILVIQGLQDRIAPPANGYHLKAEFPDRVEVVDLDGAGHALCSEKPREIAALIAAFARRLVLPRSIVLNRKNR